MIPFNKTVKVHKSNVKDKWGLPSQENQVIEYKVRLDFNGQSYVVKSMAGETKAFQAIIFFKGPIDIEYDDYVEYDSVVNGIVKDKPKKISPVNDLSGKIIYTQVKV